MEKQVAFSFDKATLGKIGRGALIAGGGTAIIYILQVISSMDFGQFTPLAVAIASIGINVCKEYVAGKK